jgi:hypothetical protein
MWIVTEYEATTLFSLKPATATASGGKTLLIPTPFAVKMALLDAACRLEGLQNAKLAWEWLRSLGVAIRPPQEIVVNNTFIKTLKPRRNAAGDGSVDAGYFMRTITYREYAQLVNPFAIGLELSATADSDALARWMVCINYLGKRGSFMQMVTPPEHVDKLPLGFLLLDGHLEDEIDLNSLLTQLDDVAAEVSFEQVDIYSPKRLVLGKDRLLYNVTLPYEQASSSRSYTHYRRSY